MRFLAAFALMGILPATLSAGEKKLMHCFAFTTVPTATEAQWGAFAAATDALPGKIPGVTKVWHGKLRAPLNIFAPDPETRKKLMAGETKVGGEVSRLQRSYAVCMEMADEAALKTYAAHPAHAEWSAAYEKVRAPGTTTIDILGQ